MIILVGALCAFSGGVLGYVISRQRNKKLEQRAEHWKTIARRWEENYRQEVKVSRVHSELVLAMITRNL